MEIMFCNKGHCYNRELYDECPECARLEKGDSAEESLNLEDFTWESVDTGATCVNGHSFNKDFWDRCPFCGAPEQGAEKKPILWQGKQKREQPEDLTRIPDPQHTLIFLANGDLSFCVWCRARDCYLTVRNQMNEPWPVLEKTVQISVEDVNRVGNQILKILSENEAEAELRNGGFAKGDTRLVIHTRKTRYDYRGDSWRLPGPVRWSLNKIVVVFGDLFNHSAGYTRASRPEKDGLLAELEFGTTNCSLRRQNRSCSLEVQNIVYYDFTTSFTMQETVQIPAEAADQMLEWLSNCGAMEALIQKNKRPDDGICRDPAVATIFYLKTGGLTYSYRDWDKSNYGSEDDAMRSALKELLTCFDYYRDGAEKG